MDMNIFRNTMEHIGSQQVRVARGYWLSKTW